MLLDYFSPFFMKVVRSSQDSTEILTNMKFSGLSKLVLSPIKDTLFFFSLLALLAVNLGPIRDLIPELRTKARWLHILLGFLIASVFIFSIMPQSHGLVYAKLALDPFAQEPSFWHKRTMMPALANFSHLAGIMYVVFFWTVAAFVLALVNIDRGPNTGGMGAYSPAPVVTEAIHARIMREVMEPTVRGLAGDGTPYVGFLYAGVMIASDGTPNVLEFNCRFGDPETQPIMMRLQSDLIDLCEAALAGKLNEVNAQWDDRAALGVVLAAGGYPGDSRKGDAIEGLESAAKLPGKIFHAGAKLVDGKVVTNGGRVLCAVGLGTTVGESQKAAYALADRIKWDGVQYRRDIGYRAIAREHAAAGSPETE